MSVPHQQNYLLNTSLSNLETSLQVNNINTVQLPSHFYEKLLSLENELIYSHSFSTINELMEMYKLGVEFYCGCSSSKQMSYMNKIKDLLMNKTIVKIIEENTQTYNSYLSTIESISEIENYVINNESTENTNVSSIEMTEEMDQTVKIQNKLKNIIRNKRKDQFYIRKKCLSKIKTKLSHNSLYNNSSLKIKKRFNRLITNKSNLHIENEIIGSSNDRFNKALEIINNDLNIQSKQFQTSLKNKQLESLRLKFITNFKIDSKVDNKKAIKKKLTLTEERFAPKLKTSFKNMISPIFTNSSKNLKLMKKCRRKITSINQVFDYFLNKFIKIYFKYVCDELINMLYKIINKYYMEKINNYSKIQDEIEELLHLYYNDLDIKYSKSIDLMIKQLSLQRETDSMNIERELKVKLENTRKSHNSFCCSHIIEVGEITEELIKKLINLLINTF